jgi:hypothetical protein
LSSGIGYSSQPDDVMIKGNAGGMRQRPQGLNRLGGQSRRESIGWRLKIGALRGDPFIGVSREQESAWIPVFCIAAKR